MSPLPVASLTTMESNQRVDSVRLGRPVGVGSCTPGFCPLICMWMSGWDISSLIMCEMPLSFGHLSDTGVGLLSSL